MKFSFSLSSMSHLCYILLQWISRIVGFNQTIFTSKTDFVTFIMMPYINYISNLSVSNPEINFHKMLTAILITGILLPQECLSVNISAHFIISFAKI